MEENNKQAKWNLASDTILLIANIRMNATAYSLGHQPKKSMDEIVIPNHRKAFQCWIQIALLIDNRLKNSQKEKLRKLNNELVRGSKKLNPKYNPENSLSDEPKYLRLSNNSFGLKSRKFIKYVDYLIKEIGMGIGDIDENEGLM